MGLFTRKQALPDSEWRPDADGAGLGPDIGGDIQRGNAYSVRYIRPDMPGSLITVSFYPVEYDSCLGEFVVQRQVEWLVCEDPSDPGGTEIWSDYDYTDVSDVVAGSAGEAEQEAREFADAALGQGWTHRWDGEPDWSR